MVSIEIQRNSDGQVVGCHMSGHAGYDEHGFDIVCAAVSALSASAMLGLTQIARQEGEYTNSEGQCDIVLSGTINQSLMLPKISSALVSCTSSMLILNCTIILRRLLQVVSPLICIG